MFKRGVCGELSLCKILPWLSGGLGRHVLERVCGSSVKGLIHYENSDIG